MPNVAENEFELTSTSFLSKRARGIFLHLISQNRKGAIDSLIGAPLSAYLSRLLLNRTVLHGYSKDHQERLQAEGLFPQADLSLTHAIHEIIPDWVKLDKMHDAHDLCRAMRSWAIQWNLAENWCLDFALCVLRRSLIPLFDEFISRHARGIEIPALIDEMSIWLDLPGAWNDAIIWDLTLDSLKAPVYSDEFHFNWNPLKEPASLLTFEIFSRYTPARKSESAFRVQVSKKFWEQFNRCLISNADLMPSDAKIISRELDRFSLEIDNFISRTKRSAKAHFPDLFKHRDLERNLRWLVDFQIPPSSSCREIADKGRVDEKTVRVGIKNATRLLELTPREPLPAGRPRNKKEFESRIISGRL